MRAEHKQGTQLIRSYLNEVLTYCVGLTLLHSTCQSYRCWNLICAVLGDHGAQAWSLTVLVLHRFTHSKHKCGGKPDVFGRDQCPVVTGWMAHNIALSEHTPTSRLDCCLNQAGGHTRCVHHHWGMVSNETPVQGPCWPIAGLDCWGPWAA